MSAQDAPAVSQRCHWKEYVNGGVPDHVPGEAVRTAPSWGVPEIMGGEVLEGGTGAVATTEVAEDAADAEPPVLDALTTTFNVAPTSTFVTE
jgi:hypothetical protein